MSHVNATGKKKDSGSQNRKRTKQNAQRNAEIVSKMPKLHNYFSRQDTSNYFQRINSFLNKYIFDLKIQVFILMLLHFFLN